MRTRTKRTAAAVGLLAMVGLSACSAEVDTNPDEGGVRVDVEASEGVDDEGSE
ncbi:MAG: hypothetical protein KY437_04035 [Actinobacteria bacterium]|nr:hypothetical protein [Actinomycetota bacterium]